jgi:hypothetical protein
MQHPHHNKQEIRPQQTPYSPNNPDQSRSIHALYLPSQGMNPRNPYAAAHHQAFPFVWTKKSPGNPESCRPIVKVDMEAHGSAMQTIPGLAKLDRLAANPAAQR